MRRAIYEKLERTPPLVPRRSKNTRNILIIALACVVGVSVFSFFLSRKNDLLPMGEDIPISENMGFNTSPEELIHRFGAYCPDEIKKSGKEDSNNKSQLVYKYTLPENVVVSVLKDKESELIDSVRIDFNTHPSVMPEKIGKYAVYLIHSMRPSCADEIVSVFQEQIAPNIMNPFNIIPAGDVALSSFFDGANFTFGISVSDGADSRNFYEPKSDSPTDAPKTRSFSRELGSGHYTAGIDIPEGTYKITAIKGGGNVTSSNFSINEIMGVPSKNDTVDLYTEKVEDVYLGVGDTLSIRRVKVGMSSRDASAEPLQERSQEITEQKMLDPIFSYVSGTDFDPGTYCIEVVSGRGNVWTEDGGDLGLNVIMGTADNNDGNSDFYEQQFNNVFLPDRTVLYVGDVTIRLTPSK